MAIIISKTPAYGFDKVAAYSRVENVILKSKTLMEFSLRFYVSTNYPFFDEMACTAPYDMDGENPIKQAYDFIRAMPEFKDTENC